MYSLFKGEMEESLGESAKRRGRQEGTSAGYGFFALNGHRKTRSKRRLKRIRYSSHAAPVAGPE